MFTYFDRDLSWLSFNYRILQEAQRPNVPLYERLKFLAIYSSNLDEFFRVRVASLRSLAQIEKKKLREGLGFGPAELLAEVLSVVGRQQEEFGRTFREQLLPELAQNGVILCQGIPDQAEHLAFVKKYFRSRVLAYLQPVILGKRKAPFLENRALYFAVALRPTESRNQAVRYAIVNIPSQYLPRFVALPQLDGKHCYAFLDDVVRAELPMIFPNFEILDCYSIKLNRDAELNIDDEYEGDLVKKIKKRLTKRNVGVPSRFLYDAAMPADMLETLMQAFGIQPDECSPGGRYHNFNDLMGLPNPLGGALEYPKPTPVPYTGFDRSTSLFEEIRKGDVLLHFPYQPYDYVLQFFNEAAIDPHVKEIKLTVYRIAANSFVANALISAARNGKKVTVFVEVKARFDEDNNLRWAAEMAKAGVNIIYSIPGLKVHAKVALILRKKGNTSEAFAYLGTGNFNESTAKIYADHGLFTCRPAYTDELEQVFHFLEDQSFQPTIQHLLVAQVNMQPRFVELIDREIAHAQAGKPAFILIKINNLEDKAMIQKLYEANQAGVDIQLIIRGICCLVPGVEGQSERIRVTRIVDRFLEHARVFIFQNDGQEEVFLGSADWMKRNLYRRVEVVFPLFDEPLKQQVKDIIRLQLTDNTQAVWLDAAQENRAPVIRTEQAAVRAQWDTFKLLGSVWG